MMQFVRDKDQCLQKREKQYLIKDALSLLRSVLFARKITCDQVTTAGKTKKNTAIENQPCLKTTTL
jgi:hypothetical protein